MTRSRRAGVQYILNPGIDLETSRSAIRLADLYEEVYVAVGVHPNEALSWNTTTLIELRELCEHAKVIAIGEIGLDYYRDRAPRDQQVEIFRAQLGLATEVGLPVVIHCRDAADHKATREVISIISEWQAGLASSRDSLAERPGVLHSFSGNPALALEAVQSGFRIGITGPVTFRNGKLIQDVVASLPVESLLIETDAPFLTPHPHRGQRNEPAHVEFVAQKIAQIHNLPDDIAQKILTSNAERLFHWQARN